MKKIFFTLFLVAAAFTGSAQKFFYVDSDFIMENVPEFQSAQKEIDALSTKWAKEIEDKRKEIEDLKASYQAELVLLTDQMRADRQKEIQKKESELQTFQIEKFGVEGELFKKRKTLVQPIQERVYDAIREVAESGGYGMVFDKSKNPTMLYGSDKLDKSKLVLRKMGVKLGVK